MMKTGNPWPQSHPHLNLAWANTKLGGILSKGRKATSTSQAIDQLDLMQGVEGSSKLRALRLCPLGGASPCAGLFTRTGGSKETSASK